MKLREIVENIKQSQIYKLRGQETILGYRVKLFNTDTLKFDFYDFSARTIENSDININNIPDVGYIDVKKIDNVWYSEAEIQGKVVIAECKTLEQIQYILKKLSFVYKYKEATVNV